MTFRARLDDAESRAFWDSVDRGAKAYDDLPNWQKGILRGVEDGPDAPDAGCPAPTQGEATVDPHAN
jgi:hypothetical protein